MMGAVVKAIAPMTIMTTRMRNCMSMISAARTAAIVAAREQEMSGAENGIEKTTHRSQSPTGAWIGKAKVAAIERIRC